jgi:hypothetical protein
MEISEGFQVLINAAMADGKISKKEKAVLLKRAEKEGLDSDEFLMYLDSILHSSKLSTKTANDFWNKKAFVIPGIAFQDEIVVKMRTAIFMVGFSFLSLIIVIPIALEFIEGNIDAENAMTKRYGCDSFNDCLSKQRFDGAYYFLDKQPKETREDNYKSVINAQIAYWNKKNNFIKSIEILQEFNIANSHNLNTDDEEANVAYNDDIAFYNNLLDDIINKMMLNKVKKNDQLKTAKLYKEIVIGNEEDKAFFGGGYNSYVLSNSPYQKALVKINESN